MGRIWMSHMLEAIADLGRQYFERPKDEFPPDLARKLCHDLLSHHGEASGTALAREVIELYRGLDEPGQDAFLAMLAEDFEPDAAKLRAAAARYLAAGTPEAYLGLSAAVESPRQELLRRINMAPGATAEIVKMREVLTGRLAHDRNLKTLEADFRNLLNSWFNQGFLQFEQIDWRTPAVILEKLIAYEAVHEIRGWGDLRRRLADDRRCFAFFHPGLPDEPLIFVEVALTEGIAATIQPLLDLPPAEPDEASPDTAVFYSISNCQAGLVGISFGNFLIKHVVDALSTELPQVTNFVTLSPVPSFRRWVDAAMAGARPESLTDDEARRLSEPGWATNDAARPALEKTLLWLCVTYLTEKSEDGLAIDPVARFHLGNGASIEHVNWAGDLSEKGLHQSAGIMVNYRYDPDRIVANHEAYVSEGIIALSPAVKSLASGRA